MQNKCFIFTGGERIVPKNFNSNYFENSFLIAADSGVLQILELSKVGIEITPELILGDMDSFDRNTANKLFKSAEFIPFPPEKDYTDTQLALKIAIDMGYTDIEIIGGTGGRCDHYLSNLLLFKYCSENGIKLTVCDGKNKIFYCDDSAVDIIKDEKYKYLSIIPFGSPLLGVSIKGTKYELENADISDTMPVTISNEIVCDTCNISVNVGSFYIILSGD